MHRLTSLSRFKSKIRLKVINSSLHGLPQIFHAHQCLAKVTWALCWLFGAALTTTLILNSVREYFKYNITTKSHIHDTYRLIFPRVTICNLDPFTTNASVAFLATLARNQTLMPLTDMAKFATDLDMVNFFIRHENLFDFKVKALFAANSSELELQRSLGYDLRTFVQSCRIGQWRCDWLFDFDLYYHYQFGNCFVFNPATQAESIYVYQVGEVLPSLCSFLFRIL